MKDINSISVLKSTNDFGNWARLGIIFVDYKSGNRLMASPSSPVLWYNNGDVRFKENFGDTIYTIKQNKLENYAVFNTGDYYWPVSERMSTEKNNKRVIIPYVTENDKSIFFQCNMGLYADNILYNGIYNKETKITKIAKRDKDIEDDITSFLPFKPLTVGSLGEYAGYIEAPDALDWLEEHPATEIKGELNFLDKLTEDMNPIIVLVEP